MSAIEYLAPLILAAVAVGVTCLGIAAWQQWKAWPAPQDWRSRYGRIPPRV